MARADSLVGRYEAFSSTEALWSWPCQQYRLKCIHSTLLEAKLATGEESWFVERLAYYIIAGDGWWWGLRPVHTRGKYNQATLAIASRSGYLIDIWLVVHHQFKFACWSTTPHCRLLALQFLNIFVSILMPRNTLNALGTESTCTFHMAIRENSCMLQWEVRLGQAALRWGQIWRLSMYQ